MTIVSGSGELVVGSCELGAGSCEFGVWSREFGAGSVELGAIDLLILALEPHTIKNKNSRVETERIFLMNLSKNLFCFPSG